MMVLVIVLTMSVVAIGIMSFNVSQVTSSQSVVDSIKAEQLAIGAFYQYHQQVTETGNPTPGAPTQEILDGKAYTITVSNLGPSVVTPNSTSQIEVQVNF